MSDETEKPSPFDRFPGDSIPAAVVDGTRIHGYDLPSDLAANYRFGELQLLALTGEAPTEAAGRAFETCLAFLMPVSIAEASVHAGRVASHVHSILGNTPAAVATIGIGLAEQARYEVETLEPWLTWIDEPSSDAAPPEITPADEGEANLTAQFLDALPAFEGRPNLRSVGAVSLLAAIVAVLQSLGLRERHQLTAALVLGRFSTAIAETFGAPDPSLWAYPLNLPRWKYLAEEE